MRTRKGEANQEGKGIRKKTRITRTREKKIKHWGRSKIRTKSRTKRRTERKTSERIKGGPREGPRGLKRGRYNVNKDKEWWQTELV